MRVEHNQFYAPFVAFKSDPWLWDILVTGSGAVTETFDLGGLPGDVSGTVPVRVGVVGATKHPHRVVASLNGYALGATDFDGLAMAWVAGEVPAEALRTAGNELTLEYEAVLASDDDVGLAFLDVVDFDFAPTRGETSYELAPFDRRLPALKGKNYLIVTHALFRAQAERIAALKAAEGFSRWWWTWSARTTASPPASSRPRRCAG